MSAKAIELMKEILARTQRWANATPEERERFECRAEDLLPWLHGDVRQRFNEIDAYFRKNQQKFWIQTL